MLQGCQARSPVTWRPCCLLPDRCYKGRQIRRLRSSLASFLQSFGARARYHAHAADGGPANPLLSVEVIVTGSNIPTAEEVVRSRSIPIAGTTSTRLGVRSATDFVQKLPMVTGPSINENVNTLGNGQTEIDLRGLAPKETLVLQDGRRVATDGFAGYTVGANSFFGGTVDLNMFPIGLIDHIDILLDGASAIYGGDAIGGVFNVSLIHRFQNHAEVYFSYGNTNLGASNDQAEEVSLRARRRR